MMTYSALVLDLLVSSFCREEWERGNNNDINFNKTPTSHYGHDTGGRKYGDIFTRCRDPTTIYWCI